MAETRYHDCPECGRENVIGYIQQRDGDQIAKVAGGGGGAALGALVGGPIGAAVGFAIGKWCGDKFAEPSGWYTFNFKCPRCGKEFSKKYKI